MRVLIVVTHLLGSGHLVRAATLGRAFAAAGWSVDLISGGRPLPHLDTAGLRVVQLPPVHVEGTDFGTLHGPGGPVDNAYLARRRAALLDALKPMPDLIITELFPFGRRNLRGEFTALLESATAPVLASVRDILAPPSKPKRAAWTHALINGHYAGVLVHSDAALIPLEASWPVPDTLRPKLHYTGFVAPPPPSPGPDGAGEVLVSAGGGPVGARILALAVQAARLDPDRTWRCLVRAEPPVDAPPNLVVEPPRPDFRARLMRAAASVSMCGYNTALDLLQTGAPAVLVPFDEGAEVEQSLRAQALVTRPGFALLRQAGATGTDLLQAIQSVTRAPRRAPLTEGMDGAAEAVRIAEGILRDT